MNEYAERLAGHALTVEDDLAREFEACLVESSTLAVRVAYSVVRNQADAEDVAQNAFVRAHRAFRSLRDRDRFRAWLVRMTWRMALDRQRAHRRRMVREDALRPITVVLPHVEAEERSELLWRAIDALSEKLRVVIVLAAIEGYDVREVATLLELPEGTVKSRLFLARQQLKESLAWMARTDRR